MKILPLPFISTFFISIFPNSPKALAVINQTLANIGSD